MQRKVGKTVVFQGESPGALNLFHIFVLRLAVCLFNTLIKVNVFYSSFFLRRKHDFKAFILYKTVRCPRKFLE